MNYIDLHTHTTYSDGTCTPEELMNLAANKNLKAIAVTDHDTIEGLPESAFHAEKHGIEFVPGVELAALYTNTCFTLEFHILGYYIDANNKELTATLENLRTKRQNRNLDIIAALNKEGVAVTIEDIEAISGGSVISRAHFAKFLVSGGYCESIKDAFKQYLGKGKKAYVKRQLPDCRAAIQTIKNAGGIAALAHPVEYGLDYGTIYNIASELKGMGLSAIESIYSTNSGEDEKKYIETARKNSLLITGGSDFHGENKPGLSLGSGYGNLRIEYSVLEELKRLI